MNITSRSLVNLFKDRMKEGNPKISVVIETFMNKVLVTN